MRRGVEGEPARAGAAQERVGIRSSPTELQGSSWEAQRQNAPSVVIFHNSVFAGLKKKIQIHNILVIGFSRLVASTRFASSHHANAVLRAHIFFLNLQYPGELRRGFVV